MARLPMIGRDDGSWGDILNEFLRVEHKEDGTLQRSDDIDSALANANAALTQANSAVATANGKYNLPAGGVPFADLETSVQSVLAKADNAVAVVPATINSKGTVRLNGDLGGTADSPTTPTAVHLTGDETINGVKTFVVAPIVPDNAFTKSAVVGLTTDMTNIQNTVVGLATDITNLQSGMTTLANAKAPLTSPIFGGIPTTPTAASGTNTTQVASTAFVHNEIAAYDTTAKAYVDTKITANTFALPAQTGNGGKFLTTDGSTASWGTVSIPQTTTPLILNAYGGTFSPAKSTTYYFGSLWNVNPTTTANVSRVYIPRSGTIKKVFAFFNQNVGSSEVSTLSIRLNNTANTVVSSTIANSSSAVVFSHTSLAIAVSEGDYIELKWDTPAWTTAPNNVRISATIYME